MKKGPFVTSDGPVLVKFTPMAFFRPPAVTAAEAPEMTRSARVKGAANGLSASLVLLASRSPAGAHQRYSLATSRLSYPSSTCTTRIFLSETGDSWPIGI